LERVEKGLADRVVAMAEKEQSHRHKTLDSVVEKEFTFRKRGQWFMLAALSLLLATVAYLASLGDTKSAVWLGAATIVAVVSVIISGRLFDSRDQSDDSETLSDNGREQKTNSQQKQLPKNKPKKRR
jgi:uncharacterized membrane protein